MPTKHCSWGVCKSDSRQKDREHMKDVIFFKFPNQLQEQEKYKRWVHLCGRADLTAKPPPPNQAIWPKWICSKHFQDGRPTEINPHPLPAHYTEKQISKATRTTARRKRSSAPECHPPKCKIPRQDATLSTPSSPVPSCSPTQEEVNLVADENTVQLQDQLISPTCLSTGTQTHKLPVNNETLKLRVELILCQNEIKRLKLEVEALQKLHVPAAEKQSVNTLPQRNSVVPLSSSLIGTAQLLCSPNYRLEEKLVAFSDSSPQYENGNWRKIAASIDCKSKRAASIDCKSKRAASIDCKSKRAASIDCKSKRALAEKENSTDKVSSYTQLSSKLSSEMASTPSEKRESEQNKELENKPRKNKPSLFLFDNLSKNPKMFEYYTGVSLDSFSMLWHFISEDAENLQYWHSEKSLEKGRGENKRERSGMGAESTNSGVGQKKIARIFRAKDELVFTLIRLRRGRTLKELSFETGVSETYMRRLFTTWIQLLYVRFSALRTVMFSTLKHVSKNTPVSMRGHNVRVIIDCTEFACHQPKHFGKNGNRYSAYKGRTTFKVLVGIAPAGYISYISDAFEGSISDVEIVRKCDFLSFIEEGDVVMADRGFIIGETLARKKAKLLIPPFLKGRKRFTPQEEAKTKFIAKNRIHVERAIDRIKQFKLLKGSISAQMENLFSQCVFIAACLVNYQSPLAL